MCRFNKGLFCSIFTGVAAELFLFCLILPQSQIALLDRDLVTVECLTVVNLFKKKHLIWSQLGDMVHYPAESSQL